MGRSTVSKFVNTLKIVSLDFPTSSRVSDHIQLPGTPFFDPTKEQFPIHTLAA